MRFFSSIFWLAGVLSRLYVVALPFVLLYRQGELPSFLVLPGVAPVIMAPVLSVALFFILFGRAIARNVRAHQAWVDQLSEDDRVEYFRQKAVEDEEENRRQARDMDPLDIGSTAWLVKQQMDDDLSKPHL